MMAALQDASMKVCIGHAGILSAVGFACGASFHLETQRESAISLHTLEHE